MGEDGFSYLLSTIERKSEARFGGESSLGLDDRSRMNLAKLARRVSSRIARRGRSSSAENKENMGKSSKKQRAGFGDAGVSGRR